MFENVWTTIITLFWLVVVSVLFIVTLVLSIYYLSKRNAAREAVEAEASSASTVAPD
jgi:hypothetical protein